MDKLLDEGRSQIDVRKRKAVYAQAEQVISEDANWVVAYHTSFVAARSRSVRSQLVHPLRYWDFRRTYLEA